MLAAEAGRRSLRLEKFRGGSSILTILARLKRGIFQYGCLLGGASEVALVGKNAPANAGNVRDEIDPWVGTIPRRKKWKPTPVFLSGESHGQRNLVGYSPQGQKESDMTEVTAHAHTSPGKSFSCLT